METIKICLLDEWERLMAQIEDAAALAYLMKEGMARTDLPADRSRNAMELLSQVLDDTQERMGRLREVYRTGNGDVKELCDTSE